MLSKSRRWARIAADSEVRLAAARRRASRGDRRLRQPRLHRTAASATSREEVVAILRALPDLCHRRHPRGRADPRQVPGRTAHGRCCKPAPPGVAIALAPSRSAAALEMQPPLRARAFTANVAACGSAPTSARAWRPHRHGDPRTKTVIGPVAERLGPSAGLGTSRARSTAETATSIPNAVDRGARLDASQGAGADSELKLSPTVADRHQGDHRMQTSSRWAKRPTSRMAPPEHATS